ncbi:TetR/AcrR family transcriptional regulator [Leptospira sp. 85282-16]|uniref:TetR/AcrR family transcriptional regulator n=1 Tax=Leptospira montravelensis TaxID=2484961 RepID=A0ABY2LNS8_9LEPT|nr:MULTISPECIES: TetR/AcrR family transcriptional regulator [Leptospira]MCT8333751.1 TetR/AcrR family transcriptional regulator [Leptospira sp. 85282-16]TGK80162.1 TetR/AcrR family transcriptional regulator [Leptospira montravelensis]TGL00332.1 TetR/AcrR family transcriptional regulator [Leptospira montravelensis]
MDPVQIRILDKAEELFSKYGYSKTKMEEIASSLKISRKTLYKFYSNKQDLLEFYLDYRQKVNSELLNQIADDETLTAVEKFNKMHKNFVEDSPNTMLDEFIREISELFPHIAENINKYRETELPKILTRIFNTAKKKGELRDGFMPEVAVHLFLASIDKLINNKSSITVPLNIHQFQNEVVNVIFYGILKR